MMNVHAPHCPTCYPLEQIWLFCDQIFRDKTMPPEEKLVLCALRNLAQEAGSFQIEVGKRTVFGRKAMRTIQEFISCDDEEKIEEYLRHLVDQGCIQRERNRITLIHKVGRESLILQSLDEGPFCQECSHPVTKVYYIQYTCSSCGYYGKMTQKAMVPQDKESLQIEKRS